MRKRLPALLLLCVLSTFANAQLLRPVKWTFHVEQQKPEEATLVFDAAIDPEWHMYSIYTPDGGPFPTAFTFNPASCYQLTGKTTESPAPHVEFDSTFLVNVHSFAKQVTFKQKIKLNGACTLEG